MQSSNLGAVALLIALVCFFVIMNSPAATTFALAALVGVVVLAACFVIGYTAFWLIRNKMSPVVRVEAAVVRRCMKEWDVSLPGESTEMAAARLATMGRYPKSAAKAFLKTAASSDAPSIEIAGGVDYYVTFSINGREVEFTVPEDSYIRADEGASGLLVFQGEQFNDFIRHSYG